MNDKYIEDVLTVCIDVSPNDHTALTVARIKDGQVEIINMFKDDEAVELYNKLIGVK